jgi:hypothetical protein
MDEYADIYYVDGSRNAGPNDHRTGTPMSYFPTPRAVPPPAGAVTARTVYVQPAQPVSYAQPLVYTQPTQQSPLSMLFGNMQAGQVIALIADALAAFRSLPAAPVSTKDIATDIANGVTYDTALAQHAKTDEQIRTIGHLVAKLVR